MFKVFTLLAMAIALLVAGGSSAEAKGKRGKLTPAERFDRRDTDHDGRLSKAEFLGNLTGDRLAKAEKAFAKLDANGDGYVTKAEIAAKMAKRRKKV